VQLPVRYDGADLDPVARETGLTTEELIALHSGAEYTVRFCGFSPGFGYLTGLDRRLWLPRLATPRPAVPAGSVAIADEYTGVYPRSSPGGWRLLGSTDVPLFELDRQPPAVLAPGVRVRFIPR
jgi:KipI family sensor histidine kinase inhibitor